MEMEERCTSYSCDIVCGRLCKVRIFLRWIVVKVVSLGVSSRLNNSGVHPVSKAELRENVIPARDCARSRASHSHTSATQRNT